MLVSFPHMGNLDIGVTGMFTALGTEAVAPPPITRHTLELGTQYSPESACLPFKIHIGNFIEAMEQGADTLIMLGGWGPCRLGYYAQIERDILQSLGYEFNMIVLEAPDSRWGPFIELLKPLGNGASTMKLIRSLQFGWEKIKAADLIDRKHFHQLPYARYPDIAMQQFHRALQDLRLAKSKEEIQKVVDDYDLDVERLVKVNRHPLKIAVVGEIYTILEPFANFNLQERLGRLGVESERSLYMTEWVNDHVTGGRLKVGSSEPHKKMGAPYLPCWVGGHGQETIGYAVSYARQGYDGVIQIGPLTCMPEIVAQAILPSVAAREQIPIMSLWVDEQTGEAGLQTRLEAFVDMLERKQRKSSPGGLYH